MIPWSLSIESVSLPHVDSTEALLCGDYSTELEIYSGDMSLNAQTYDCIVKAKALFATLEEPDVPIFWLLPAWIFLDKQKEVVIESFKRLFSATQDRLFFLGVSAIDGAIQSAIEQKVESFYVIAVDGVSLPNANKEYLYYGVGGIVAKLDAIEEGWRPYFFDQQASIDFVQHDAFKAIFRKVILDAERFPPIDIIFSPGNAICKDANIWLYSLGLLAPHLNEDVEYVFPAYILGKIGAMAGIVNMYSLINSPNFLDKKHVIMISQEQSIYQAAAAYTWGKKIVRDEELQT